MQNDGSRVRLLANKAHKSFHTYGGFYSVAAPYTLAAGLNNDTTLVITTVVSKELNGFELLAGGGLKNLGSAGWFYYSLVLNNAGNNSGVPSAGTVWRFGARVREIDGITFKPIVDGGIGAVYAGNIPIGSSYGCRVYMEKNEVVFPGGAWTSSPGYGVVGGYTVDIFKLN